jgi:hypothetical protein
MMDLEQRVQALEQELQILKNQIQVMLLDIQEQVLSNTYPGLRSGDVPPPDSPPVSRPQAEAEVQKRPSSPVHKVSFDDFNSEEKPAAPPPKQSVQPAWEDMAELEAWASRKLETVGSQETVELIRMYTAKGRLSPEVQDALLEFVAFKSSEYRDIPTQPSRSAVFGAAPRPAPNGRTQKAPTPASAPKAPAKSPRAKASANPSNHNHNKENTSKPKIRAVKTPSESSQNLVLKLIAGVQNAGAGVKWGKHDG